MESYCHKIVISKDVIFVKDQLQKKDEDDNTVKKKSKTVPVYVENNPENSNSFKVAPEHKNKYQSSLRLQKFVNQLVRDNR